MEDQSKAKDELLQEIEQLKQQLEFYENKENELAWNLIHSTSVSVVIHWDEKILFTNSATLNLVKANKLDEIIGHSIFEFIVSSSHVIAKEYFATVISGKLTNAPVEGQTNRSDGSVLDVEILTSLISYHGGKALQSVFCTSTLQGQSTLLAE